MAHQSLRLRLMDGCRFHSCIGGAEAGKHSVVHIGAHTTSTMDQSFMGEMPENHNLGNAFSESACVTVWPLKPLKFRLQLRLNLTGLRLDEVF